MTDSTAEPGALVRVERAAGFWFACLNRPERRNALTDALVVALGAVFEQVAADLEARALVVCGAGDNFCAGADFHGFLELLNGAAGAVAEPIARANRRFGSLLEQLAALPVPTVAVVSGAAIGGGCGLAAACDRVLAADDAVFAMPEVTLGIAPAQIAPFVARRAGVSRGRWLMLSAARLPAVAARDAGLADIVVPRTELRGTLTAELRLLAAADPTALRATKRIVALASDGPLPATLDAAALEFAGLLCHGNAREGIAATREKRPPAWRAAVPGLPDFL